MVPLAPRLNASRATNPEGGDRLSGVAVEATGAPEITRARVLVG